MKKKLFKKLSDRYRLIIYNDTTFQSVWSIKLTRLKVFTITTVLSAILIILVILVIATTGLREYIPGYPKAEYRQMLIGTALKIDSLENELYKRDQFFIDIKSIITGDLPDDPLMSDTTIPHDITEIEAYNHDSVFQDKLLAEQTNLLIDVPSTGHFDLSRANFFIPVKGIITNKFKSTTDHLGVDLVSEPNARIAAIMDGTVVFSGWTLETGFVIVIQHNIELISIYKHNSVLLKKSGDKVRAGEGIAIIGNTGEFTTGPHLHFELWHNGTPLDPEKYIDF